MHFPADVWDHVLTFGGPLCMANDRMHVASIRVQRAWRQFCVRHPVLKDWKAGIRVQLGMTHPKERGTLCYNDAWKIRRETKKSAYVWVLFSRSIRI